MYVEASRYVSSTRLLRWPNWSSWSRSRSRHNAVFQARQEHNASSRPVVPEPSSTPASRKEVSDSNLSYSWEIDPPTASQLSYARKFFTNKPPQLVFSATKLLKIPFTQVPEVAFLGRSNVGKSSVLNAVMNTQICKTSRKPGATKSMNGFAVGGPDGAGNKGRLNVLDMPGYGKGSHAAWGAEIVKYLAARKELKRVFVCINPMHGLKDRDAQLLSLLRRCGISHQIVLLKVDMLLATLSEKTEVLEQLSQPGSRAGKKLREVFERIRRDTQLGGEGMPAFGQLLACCVDTTRLKNISITAKVMGIDAVRWAILVATGLHQRRSTEMPEGGHTLKDVWL